MEIAVCKQLHLIGNLDDRREQLCRGEMDRPQTLLCQPDKPSQKSNGTDDLYHHEQLLGCIQTILYLCNDIVRQGIDLLDRVGVLLPEDVLCSCRHVPCCHRRHRILLERHQIVGERCDLIELSPLVILDVVRLEACQRDIPVLICI